MCCLLLERKAINSFKYFHLNEYKHFLVAKYANACIFLKKLFFLSWLIFLSFLDIFLWVLLFYVNSLPHSYVDSARGVLTTVTQPAQLWSVRTGCTVRKWCGTISVCCVCIMSKVDSFEKSPKGFCNSSSLVYVGFPAKILNVLPVNPVNLIQNILSIR